LGSPPRMPSPKRSARVSKASNNKAATIHPHLPHKNYPSSLYRRAFRPYSTAFVLPFSYP
jgi:hypothetical protein